MLCKSSSTASKAKQNQEDRANVEQSKQNYAEAAEPLKREAEPAELRGILCKTASNIKQNQQDRANVEQNT